MISIDESKIFCLYCRGEIIQKDKGKLLPAELQQYHQECFEEIIKDNHCEYCLNILNELNSLFTEQKVKIHQMCITELEKSIKAKITPVISDYLKEIPLKKLAKDFAFYEMKEEKYSPYVEDLQHLIISQLPDTADKSDEYKMFVEKETIEVIKKAIVDYTKDKLQVQLNEELKKCRSTSKKEIIDKTLQFMWKNYLEVPMSYKGAKNQKILPKPALDSVDYIIFHFKLEKLFKTALDFNSIVNRNFYEITDYLLGEPISIQNLEL